MASAKEIVLVLGSHRSGTSVITGSLVNSGLTAPEPLIGAQRHVNQTGFFEPVKLVELNDEINRTLKRSWLTHFPLKPTELPFRLKRDMLQLLRSFFLQSDRIVLKDPRMCQLVGIWAPVLRRFDSNFKIVIVVRDPRSAVKSLQRRDGMSDESALIVHLLDLFSLELFCRRQNYVMVEFEKFAANPAVEIAGVLKRLGWQVSASNSSSGHLFRPDLLRQKPGLELVFSGGLWRIAEQAHFAIVNEHKSKIDLLRQRFYRLLRIYRSTIEMYEFHANCAKETAWAKLELENEKQNAVEQIHHRDEVIDALEKLLAQEKQNAVERIRHRDEYINELENKIRKHYERRFFMCLPRVLRRWRSKVGKLW